jgi:alpha-mannosidase
MFDLGFTASTGFTCEALAWKDGTPWRGVDPNHRWLPIQGPEFDFSLVEVSTPEVKVEAIKRAEDSHATIVRLYEAWGASCSARIKTTLPARRAAMCDLLERERAEVDVQEGVVELAFTPFKVITLKLDR